MYYIFLTLLLTACTTLPVVPAAPTLPTPTPISDLDQPIANGLRFLTGQYNADYGLLQESPIVAPDRYWLATDNRLAVYALRAVGDLSLAAKIEQAIAAHDQAIAAHGGREHGLIEALTGANITWPPRTETQTQIAPLIWNEHRLFGPRYADWQEYADLSLYAALDAHNEGNDSLAVTRYRQALRMFNGIGFADKAYLAPDGHSLYATYKLALALYVAVQINEPPDSRLLPALLGKQDESGGFVTLYDSEGTPHGDANTETTSYALLALVRLAH